ncbi:MAG: hypothetical protein ABR957_13875 [Terracidiphilus sp.]
MVAGEGSQPGSDKLAVGSVIGVASLSLGMPIELEVIFEVTDSCGGNEGI